MSANAKQVGCAASVVIVILALCAWVIVAIVSGFNFGSRTLPAHPVSNPQPLMEFRDYPVYWLGMEYDGLPLTQLSITGPYGGGTERYVTLGYGYCKTSGGLISAGCGPPVTLEERPACLWYSRDPALRMNPPTVWRREIGIWVNSSKASPSSQQVREGLKLANGAYFPMDPLSVDPATFWETVGSTPCATTATPTSTSTPTSN